MKRPRYQPWRKGPAVVIPFPVPPLRCWHVHQLPCGGWRGNMLGPDVADLWVTEVGTRFLVLDAVMRQGVRLGLPVVVSDGLHCGLAIGGAA